MKPLIASARYIFLVIVVLLSGPASTAFAETSPPSLQKIIDRTLAHDDARQKMLQSMQYDQTANLDELNSKGDVKQ